PHARGHRRDLHRRPARIPDRVPGGHQRAWQPHPARLPGDGMKYTITHALNYAYDSPVRSSTQYLRLTPRDTTRQKVLERKLEAPGQPLRTTDGYGNVLHVMTVDRPVSEIAIRARGTVETSSALDEPSDFTGTPLPPLLFLRPTALTRCEG